MSNDNTLRRPDGTIEFLGVSEEVTVAAKTETNAPLPEVAVTATNINPLTRISQHNLLRSCKFAFRLDALPECSSFNKEKVKEPFGTKRLSERINLIELTDFTFLCDAIELPGRSVTTLEYLIPGLQKIKTPYRRDYNEITLSFYYNDQSKIFEFFNDWVDQMSYTTTSNRYFNDIVVDLTLIQYLDTENFSGDHEKYMSVKIINAFPINVSSLPCNWADDGFHKLSVSMFYEEAQLEAVEQ
jgi:hypothetical protein